MPNGFDAAIVVDVIRATTTAAFLLQAGAGKLLLADRLETARRLARASAALLAGERDGLPPPGFDLGNSPREAALLKLDGRPVVMTTTNGTRATLRTAALVPNVALGALVNAAAAARWATGYDSVLLVAAGRNGKLALDDAYTVGVIVSALQRLSRARLGEGALLALKLAENADAGVIAHSAAARALEKVGLERDVALCANRDALRLVPILRERSRVSLTFEGAVF